MRPKKQILDRAKQNGTIDRVNILLSSAHLAAAISNNLFQEGADLLTEAGLQVGEIKKLYTNYLTAADRYFADFATMITDEKVKHAFFSDIDDYTLAFRQITGVEDGFIPSTDGQKYIPDYQAILEAKQKQLKEFERITDECKSDITRIKEKIHLAKYGLVKGQHFIYKGVEYGNVSSNGYNMFVHKIKKDGGLYENKMSIFVLSQDITPLDKFSQDQKKGGSK